MTQTHASMADQLAALRHKLVSAETAASDCGQASASEKQEDSDGASERIAALRGIANAWRQFGARAPLVRITDDDRVLLEQARKSGAITRLDEIFVLVTCIRERPPGLDCERIAQLMGEIQALVEVMGLALPARELSALQTVQDAVEGIMHSSAFVHWRDRGAHALAVAQKESGQSPEEFAWAQFGTLLPTLRPSGLANQPARMRIVAVAVRTLLASPSLSIAAPLLQDRDIELALMWKKHELGKSLAKVRALDELEDVARVATSGEQMPCGPFCRRG